MTEKQQESGAEYRDFYLRWKADEERDELRWAYHQPLRQNWPAIIASLAFYAVLIAGIALASGWLLRVLPV
jgi:hypothetical protein